MDGGALIRRLLEAEAGGEGLVVVRREAMRVAVARGAARVQVQQFGGGVAHLLGGLAARLVPLARAQLVQRRLLGRHAGVAADQRELRHRHVQRRLVGVFQVQELARTFAQVDVDQPHVAADAVRGVHDRIAQLQLRQILDQRVDAADLLLAAPAAARRGAGGEQLVLGDELDRARAGLVGGVRLEPEEAFADRRRGDRDLLVAGLELGQRAHADRRDRVVAQHVQQRLAPAFAVGHQQDAVGRRVDVALQARHRGGGAALDADVGQRARPSHGFGGLVLAVCRGARWAQGERRESTRRIEELLALHEDVFGRQDRAIRVGLEEAVAFARVGPEALQRVVDGAVQHQRGRGRQVVEQRRGLVEEQRQVVLDAAAGDAVAHVLVQAGLGRVALDALAPAHAERLARGLVERELAPGQQAHLRHGIEAALRVGIEGADRVDLVVEQVDAVGHVGAHREQVDQAAAHGVLARRHHRADVRVAGQRQLRAQRGLVQARLLLEVEGGGGQERRRSETGQRGAGGQDHHIHAFVVFLVRGDALGGIRRRLALRGGDRHAGVGAAQALALAVQAPQRGQALGDQVLVRRELVVGQRFPIGEHGDAQVRREERQLVGQALAVGRLGADHQRQLPLRGARGRQVGDQQRIRRAGRARQRVALSGNERRQLHGGRKNEDTPWTRRWAPAEGATDAPARREARDSSWDSPSRRSPGCIDSRIRPHDKPSAR